MNSQSERWTPQERHQAIKAFLAGEEGKRFLDEFSRDEVSAQDRELFLRDATRRAQCDDEAAGRWWQALLVLIRNDPQRRLALAEPLAQHGLSLEELYEALPDGFDPQALTQAIERAGGAQDGLAPGISNTDGWTEERIRARLAEVKAALDWRNTVGEARAWWADFAQGQAALVLRLAEELAVRQATVHEFHAAYLHSDTDDIQASLHYLDYARLQQAEAAKPAIAESALTSDDTGWWLKPAPDVTRVRGWAEDRIRRRLEEVKAKLDWEDVAEDVRAWWEAFERENQQRPALVLRLAEELVKRNVSLAEFHISGGRSGVKDVRANLHYLAYSRLSGSFDYETVILDETGEIMERRSGKAHRLAEELTPGVALEMVKIPGGAFTMGSPESEAERSNSEGPQHEVTVPPFYLGKFTVTQAQWRVVAGWPKVKRKLKLAPSHFKGDERPVENVDWHDAQEFCARLSAKTGRAYRLPSEAEWEYACRAGTATPFAFGATITPEVVNYNGQYPYAQAKEGLYRGETVPVGSLGVANAFGLFDMHGNVWEWCEDVWHDSYENAPRDGSAWLSGADSTSRRLLRGGSCIINARYCRAAYRDNIDARYLVVNVGLRVAFAART